MAGTFTPNKRAGRDGGPGWRAGVGQGWRAIVGGADLDGRRVTVRDTVLRAARRPG
jgi:hypothetical protein